MTSSYKIYFLLFIIQLIPFNIFSQYNSISCDDVKKINNSIKNVVSNYTQSLSSYIDPKNDDEGRKIYLENILENFPSGSDIAVLDDSKFNTKESNSMIDIKNFPLSLALTFKETSKVEFYVEFDNFTWDNILFQKKSVIEVIAIVRIIYNGEINNKKVKNENKKIRFVVNKNGNSWAAKIIGIHSMQDTTYNNHLLSFKRIDRTECGLNNTNTDTINVSLSNYYLQLGDYFSSKNLSNSYLFYDLASNNNSNKILATKKTSEIWGKYLNENKNSSKEEFLFKEMSKLGDYYLEKNNYYLSLKCYTLANHDNNINNKNQYGYKYLDAKIDSLTKLVEKYDNIERDLSVIETNDSVQVKKILQSLKSNINLDRNNPKLYVLLANCYEMLYITSNNNYYDTIAISNYNKAIDIDYGNSINLFVNSTIYRNFEDYCIKNNHYDQAKNILLLYLKRSSPDKDYYYYKFKSHQNVYEAKVKMDADKLEEAEVDLNNALKDDPQNYLAYYYLSCLKWGSWESHSSGKSNIENYNAAISYADSSNSFGYYYPMAYYQKSKIIFDYWEKKGGNCKEYEKAINILEGQALKIIKNNYLIYNLLGDFYRKVFDLCGNNKNSLELAGIAFDNSLKYDDGIYNDAYKSRADISYILEKWASAKMDYDSVIKQDPMNEHALIYRGLSLIKSVSSTVNKNSTLEFAQQDFQNAKKLGVLSEYCLALIELIKNDGKLTNGVGESLSKAIETINVNYSGESNDYTQAKIKKDIEDLNFIFLLEDPGFKKIIKKFNRG